jgi:hypothetical protein
VVTEQVNQKLNQSLEGLSALYSQRDHLKRFLRDGLISLVPKSPTAIALNDVIAPNNLSEATSPGRCCCKLSSLCAF